MEEVVLSEARRWDLWVRTITWQRPSCRNWGHVGRGCPADLEPWRTCSYCWRCSTVKKEEIPWIFPFSKSQLLSSIAHGYLEARRQEIWEMQFLTTRTENKDDQGREQIWEHKWQECFQTSLVTNCLLQLSWFTSSRSPGICQKNSVELFSSLVFASFQSLHTLPRIVFLRGKPDTGHSLALPCSMIPMVNRLISKLP